LNCLGCRPGFGGNNGYRELGEYRIRVDPFKRKFGICRDVVDARRPDLNIGKDVTSMIVSRDLNFHTCGLRTVVGDAAHDSGEAIPG